jgi:hypothetical protein
VHIGLWTMNSRSALRGNSGWRHPSAQYIYLQLSLTRGPPPLCPSACHPPVLPCDFSVRTNRMALSCLCMHSFLLACSQLFVLLPLTSSSKVHTAVGELTHPLPVHTPCRLREAAWTSCPPACSAFASTLSCSALSIGPAIGCCRGHHHEAT